MRVFAHYSRSVEYCCPSLKEESPVLADKYAEWRDLYLKSRVTRTIPLNLVTPRYNGAAFRL